MMVARGDFPSSAGWNEAVAAIRLASGIIIIIFKSNRGGGAWLDKTGKDRPRYCKCTSIKPGLKLTNNAAMHPIQIPRPSMPATDGHPQRA